ncbi:MAG: glycosyl hydrolase family 18 protein [Acidimicrobiales bacterium]
MPTATLCLLALVTVAAGFVAAGAAPGGGSRSARPASGGAGAPDPLAFGNRMASLSHRAVTLPRATARPQAAPAALLAADQVATREDFAFAPYWTLPQSAGFDLGGLTTLAYFSIGVNPDGTLDQSGPGWNGYQSQDLANLVSRAHAADERVVLTVNDFDQGSLDALTSSTTAPHTLAAALIPALQAKNLDGVNFDFEGEGSGDRTGLTNLISSVSAALRAVDPHWQITMDTYASSAGDPGGFYNIGALAPAVDAFFVMAYNLNLQGTPGANSPLTSGQFSDLTALEQYTAVVPSSKVIVGAPFFGQDWPTANGTLQATSSSGATNLADSQIQGSSDPQYWDPVTDTGWTSYQVPGGQWHESFWDSPYALYLVSRLAAAYDARGVGIWALGMEDDDTQMISALNGTAPSGGPGAAGPTSTSASPTTTVPTTTTTTAVTPGSTAPGPSKSPTPTTTPAPTTTTSTIPAPPTITGTFNGKTVDLTVAAASSVNPLLQVGTLSDFATSDPAYACLAGSPPLPVYDSLSGFDVVEATAPADCLTQDFVFPA